MTAVDGAAHAGAADELELLRAQAVALLAALDRPPRTLRIRAGSVTLDLTWPDGGPDAGPAAAPMPAAIPEPPAAACLTSPVVGVFYQAREPGAEPFVTVGSVVRPGQQIGIVEAMKLMIPVEADRAGTVAAVLKGDGESVEYGEPLFRLES